VSVTDLRPPFRFAVRTRVGFDETDAQGIVYYGRYMPYFDLARVEYHRSLDMLQHPGQFMRHMDTPTAGLDGRHHVRLQRIANHQESIGIDAVSRQDRGVHRSGLVADDLHEAEAFTQP
jgi:hypothetical protein